MIPKGKKFEDQSNLKSIKYQNHSFKIFQSFQVVVLWVLVQNRKYVVYGVKGRPKSIIQQYEHSFTQTKMLVKVVYFRSFQLVSFYHNFFGYAHAS